MGVVTIIIIILFLVLKVVVNSTVNGPVTAGNGVVLVCNFDTGGAPSNVTWRLVMYDVS